MEKARNGPWLKWLIIGLAGGVAFAAVFLYGIKATDQRKFCISCHIMQEAGFTHKLGSHADQSCNECHAPHNFAAKIPFKAQAGIIDFAGNLSGKDVSHSPQKSTRDVVNTNCKRCHAQTNMNVASMDSKPYCIDCHRNVAHMRHQPVSKRMVGYE